MEDRAKKLKRQAPTHDEIARRAHDLFTQRGGQHGADVGDWLEAERTLLATDDPDEGTAATGISNRESADEERGEREQFPPIDSASPEPQNASGRSGEQPFEHDRDLQTSHKAGSRSIAQKEAGARYPDSSMPATRKVAGAFGKEPEDLGPA